MANHLPIWNQEVFLHQSSFLKHQSINSNWRHYQSPEDLLESPRTPCNLPHKDRMIERWRRFQLSSNTVFLMWVNFLPKTTPRSWLQDCKAKLPAPTLWEKLELIVSWGQWVNQTHPGSNLVSFKDTLPFWVHVLYLLILSCWEN